MGYRQEVIDRLDTIITILQRQIEIGERIRNEDLEMMAGNLQIVRHMTSGEVEVKVGPSDEA